MTISPEIEAKHRQQAQIATDLYTAGLAPDVSILEWHAALSTARREIAQALRATNYLTEVAAALTADAGHSRVLRALMAPPISQDQFAILCPDYSKAKENRGRPLAAGKAETVSTALLAGRDRRLTRWLVRGGPPRRHEVRVLIQSLSPILGQQALATRRRGGMSAQQEEAVIALLTERSWTQSKSALIESLTDVPAKHFMHKTRFATATRPQEVDIACGLGKTVVLAMECKVTNDALNSKKRINDVLKKATAWQLHWGNFVRTAALLQGVIDYNDVARLLDAHVEVFWSHRLQDFEAWIDANTH